MRLYENQPIGTVPRARQLRRNASPMERRLLRAVRDTFPHLKWRHQAPVGPFYADLLCFSERLILEIDGDTHVGTEVYDADRTRLMNREGFKVVRITNRDVTENLEGFLTQISLSVKPSGKGEAGTNKKGGAAAPPSPFRRLASTPSLSQGERV